MLRRCYVQMCHLEQRHIRWLAVVVPVRFFLDHGHLVGQVAPAAHRRSHLVLIGRRKRDAPHAAGRLGADRLVGVADQLTGDPRTGRETVQQRTGGHIEGRRHPRGFPTRRSRAALVKFGQRFLAGPGGVTEVVAAAEQWMRAFGLRQVRQVRCSRIWACHVGLLTVISPATASTITRTCSWSRLVTWISSKWSFRLRSRRSMTTCGVFPYRLVLAACSNSAGRPVLSLWSHVRSPFSSSRARSSVASRPLCWASRSARALVRIAASSLTVGSSRRVISRAIRWGVLATEKRVTGCLQP